MAVPACWSELGGAYAHDFQPAPGRREFVLCTNWKDCQRVGSDWCDGVRSAKWGGPRSLPRRRWSSNTEELFAHLGPSHRVQVRSQAGPVVGMAFSVVPTHFLTRILPFHIVLQRVPSASCRCVAARSTSLATTEHRTRRVGKCNSHRWGPEDEPVSWFLGLEAACPRKPLHSSAGRVEQAWRILALVESVHCACRGWRHTPSA